jgi:predicted amidohydrolase
MSLRTATSGFPMSASPLENLTFIRRHLAEASDRGAQVVHFPECALAGYAGVDLPSYDGYDWALLRRCAEQVQDEAARRGLWVLLGSSHPLSAHKKPRNCVYVIRPDGGIEDRYDKRFCAGPADGQEELVHWSSGDHVTVFSVGGVRCGVLICHECRYPELYRELERAGVQVVFHSFHAGNVGAARWKAMHDALGPETVRLNFGLGTLPGITMPATLVSMAANNHVWISASNTSAPQSCWASHVVRPDGVVVGRLVRNRAGLLVTDADDVAGYYDSTAAWRGRAMAGELRSGEAVDDPRADDRTSL